MLLTLALFTLLLVTIAGTFGTLVDSAIRAFNAYPRLRDAARVSHILVTEARLVEEIAVAPLPPVRSAGAIRTNRANQTTRPVPARAIVAA